MHPARRRIPATMRLLFSLVCLCVAMLATPAHIAIAGSSKPETRQDKARVSIDGFYVGYFSAIAGSGQAMFIFMNGRISGADFGGVLMEGRYSVSEEGKIRGSVKVKVPPGIDLIFGMKSPPEGLNYRVNFKTSIDEIASDEFSILTPLGPARVRLVRTGAIALQEDAIERCRLD